MYIFCRFDEVSANRKPKIMTFSITGSQIFFADFVFSTKTKRNTAYRKTVNNTRTMFVREFGHLHLLPQKFKYHVTCLFIIFYSFVIIRHSLPIMSIGEKIHKLTTKERIC